MSVHYNHAYILLDDYQLEFVDRDIPPWCGISLLFKMLSKCGFYEAFSSFGMPAQGSNRGYAPLQLIQGMFAGLWCGSGCFEHLDIVRYDKTMEKLLGWKYSADHRAYQRYLNKFIQAINTRCFDAMYSWFFNSLQFDNYTLDFDSTVMDRSGSQEGSAKGYNPRRPGRRSVHPLLAFVSDIRMVANYWLRPGNTGATTNFLSFLENTLSRMGNKKVGLIRADSGFYSKEIFDYLEDKKLSYIIACRFTSRFKYTLVNQKVWTEIADGIEIAETTYQADGWQAPRRIVMVRQQTGKRPNAAGKKIKQLELFTGEVALNDYRYSCYITNLELPARIIYDVYRGRADSENRIKELKHDFSIDKFTLHDFWASEACGNFIVMAYNFMSLFRHAMINSARKPFLKTMRYLLFAVAGYITQTNDRKILHLAKGLRNRDAFIGIWKSLDDFRLPYEFP